MRKTKTLTQCLALQDLIHDAALTFKGALATKDPGAPLDVKTAVALSRLACAWDTVAERARILRGRPLPGSLRPKEPRQKSRPLFASLLDGEMEALELSPTAPPCAAPTPAPMVAKPAPPKAEPVKSLEPLPCPVCKGRTKVRVSGGVDVDCPTCHGTGHRSESGA